MMHKRGEKKVTKEVMGRISPLGVRNEAQPEQSWVGFEHWAGEPAEGQVVRDGHLPKFSKMIDLLEDISMDFLGYENFIHAMKDIKKVYLQ